MSNLENDRYIEDLQDRFANLIEYVSKGDTETFQRLIVRGDLEGAAYFVDVLEALLSDDLR